MSGPFHINFIIFIMFCVLLLTILFGVDVLYTFDVELLPFHSNSFLLPVLCCPLPIMKSCY